ncbi:MAG: type II secretion system F family protein [Clostridia bacterium]|nr:type II secretion system F family protein [Clostridia bacterium]
MPDYHYIAKDMKGKTARGTVNATDTGLLAARLREQGLYLISARQAEAAHGDAKLKPKQLSEYNLNLGAMLSSGVSLIRSFEILLRRDITARERKAYAAIYDKLLQGMALSDAMESQGQVFPPLLINMYRAGEANGTLDITAMKMADHYAKEYRLRTKIKSATTYPKILLVMLVLVMFAVFEWVLPTFLQLYGDMELPGITRFVISISRLFTDHLFALVIIVLIVIFSVQLLLQIPKLRLAIDHLKLRLPLTGKLMRTIYTARFSRTLSSLYASGISILQALDIARTTVGNAYIAAQFDELLADVRNGNPLSAAVDKVDGYDKKLASVILVGEETGRLDQMLNAAADNFDYEAQQATDRLTALVEPLMIIIMALCVGVVMISVMLPLYNLYGYIDSSSGGF